MEVLAECCKNIPRSQTISLPGRKSHTPDAIFSKIFPPAVLRRRFLFDPQTSGNQPGNALVLRALLAEADGFIRTRYFVQERLFRFGEWWDGR
ncbi:MAG: hypothetical protein P4N59_05320 [Negativicutes bacterium]|nr:hypothetical protein [Negativicutes bacterium]